MTKSGMGVQLHDLPAERSGHLRGAAFVPNQCPKMTNACEDSNGGCSAICLPLPDNTKKCVCPDHAN
ncbi:hypothetical protein BV898_15898 [Hypsibius exemplaris]|uniref:Uncharacterized protein n=1 Tax=Hypsibius exemplaris TaxID=2072580 RepID=A0A9X6NCH9_HYPEX|nr:hypothetical protein BV898_15898 [Hypsibius exemplaris]